MAQFARPNGDLADGTWTGSDVGDLFALIDESVASDADYILTPLPPGGATCDLALSDVGDPGVHTGHVVRFRAGKFGMLGVNPRLTVQVRQGQGGVVVASLAVTYTVDDTFQDRDFTLTEAEAAAITDYAALTLRLIGDLGDGVTDSRIRMSWGELEVPNAAVAFPSLGNRIAAAGAGRVRVA